MDGDGWIGDGVDHRWAGDGVSELMWKTRARFLVGLSSQVVVVREK